jgi:hypothetical protein
MSEAMAPDMRPERLVGHLRERSTDVRRAARRGPVAAAAHDDCHAGTITRR